METDGYTSAFVTVTDGLKLHARDYGDRTSEALPIVCLAGLTRHSADFHALALALSRHPERPRRVVALDYRGRGLSDHDPDWTHYDPRVEAADAIAMLTALGVPQALFIGTSRGGLVTMALAAMQPARIRGVVLNDIGPVIEAGGLIRIRSQIGSLPAPRTMAEGVEVLKHMSRAQFTDLSEEDWEAWARATWDEKDGRLIPSRDANLMKGLASLDLEAPLPSLWPVFEGLKPYPVLAIRGENSDLLSPQTLAEMQARHPALEIFVVPHQGHAPLLRDTASITRIAAFIAQVEDARTREARAESAKTQLMPSA